MKYYGASKEYKPSKWAEFKNAYAISLAVLTLWVTVCPLALVIIWLAMVWQNQGWFPIWPPAWGWGW